MDYSTLMLRWVHILAASIAVGSLFYSRFAILPAIEEALDEASQVRMHEAIRKKWLRWVGGMIFFLLVSGLANFLVLNARAKGWGGGDWMKQTHYHLLFGIKFLLALSVFYFSSALIGRSKGTAWVRENRRTFLSLTVLLVLATVLVSGWMRQLHTGPNESSQIDAGASMPESSDSGERSPRQDTGVQPLTPNEKPASDANALPVSDGADVAKPSIGADSVPDAPSESTETK